MHDKNIFAWFKELEEKLGQYKYNHNFCRDVIKEWPYISFESKKDWTLMKQGQNPVWSAEVRSIIKEICPPEDFIVGSVRSTIGNWLSGCNYCGRRLNADK
jgi:hypothetical protein